jgi:GNAT superfamily N-acetyltransferase
MDIEYIVSGPVTNEELNLLFGDAWPGSHEEDDLRRVLQHGLGYICARRGGQLVGFVKIAWDGGAHAFLLDPVVRTDCQRAGIGSELVRRARDLSRKAGAEWLHVDFEPRLAEFYRRCGFRESRAGLIDLKQVGEAEDGP